MGGGWRGRQAGAVRGWRWSSGTEPEGKPRFLAAASEGVDGDARVRVQGGVVLQCLGEVALQLHCLAWCCGSACCCRMYVCLLTLRSRRAALQLLWRDLRPDSQAVKVEGWTDQICQRLLFGRLCSPCLCARLGRSYTGGDATRLGRGGRI